MDTFIDTYIDPYHNQTFPRFAQAYLNTQVRFLGQRTWQQATSGVVNSQALQEYPRTVI